MCIYVFIQYVTAKIHKNSHIHVASFVLFTIFHFLEFMSPLQGCIAWVVCGFYADTACRVPTVDIKNSRKVVPSRE